MRVCLLLALLVFSPLIGATAQVKQRKSIDELDAQQLADYLHAFDLLKQKPASDLQSYETFERLHNGGALPNGKQGGCIHMVGDFLPWHRMLLAQFEKALQETDPPRTSNVMLPYWDFSKPPTGKRFPKPFEDQSSVLWHSNRLNLLPSTPPDWVQFAQEQEQERATFMDGDFLKSTLFDLPLYRNSGGNAGFSNGLESSPHNVMHTPFTLGDMGDDVTAARDPLFWSFHCYIDLMWYQWQVQHTAFEGASPNLLPADLTKEYDQFPEPMTVGSVLNPTSLGYTYVVTSDDPQPESLAASKRLQAAPNAKFRFQWQKSEPPEANAETVYSPGATVVMAGVKHAKMGSWKVELYLHPKGTQPDYASAEFRKKYLVAQYSEWHGNHRPAHRGGKKDVILRLSKRPVATAQNGDFELSVRYRPLTIKLNGDGPSDASLESVEAIPLTFESISVNFDE